MRSKFAIVALLVIAGPASVDAQDQSGAAAIRAGRNLATSVCFTCHIATPNQAIAPVLGPGIPSFQDIANRPDVNVEVLEQRMKTATWHDKGLAATRLPMSHLSDRERMQVAAYILSLRKSD